MTRLLRPLINPEAIAANAMPQGSRVLGTTPATRDRSGTHDARNRANVLVIFDGTIGTINQPLTHRAGARPLGEIVANATIAGSYFDLGQASTPSDRFTNEAFLVPALE